jgi:transcriptional regulator with XRE-family HTH domain
MGQTQAKLLRSAFAMALRRIRKNQNLTQEDFSLISSRTYLSSLERGLKSPTLEKIDALASTMGVHPLTLMTLCYQQCEQLPSDELLTTVKKELRQFQKTG